MKDSVLDVIFKFQMLEQGDRVAVGVSGGADSMALLAFLREISTPFGLSLVACHVNHGLRGEESDRDEAFVRRICGVWGVPCRVLRIDAAGEARERGLSVEEAAREIRYGFFEGEADPGGKIATAHTASDNLETMIFNMARGTGLRGLCGIPPLRGRVIRPLIAATRQQVEDYCAQQGIPYVTDSTNLTDGNSRCVLRHHVTPVLLTLNPRAEQAALALAGRLREDEDFLGRAARDARACLTRGDGLLDRRALASLEPPLRSRILLALQGEAGCAPSSRLEYLMAAAVASGRGAVALGPGRSFFADGDKAGLREEKRATESYCLPVPSLQSGETCRIALPDGRVFQGNCTNLVQNSEKVHNCPLKNLLDYDRIKGTVVARPRLPGDSIRLAGRDVTKTLKNLFQEAGVSPELRERRLLLADGEGVLWVEGFGAAQRAVPDQTTGRLLSITILHQSEETQ